MLISVAIPCYKSAKTVPKVVDNICKEFTKYPDFDYEIILVNDGSPDQGATWAAISAMARNNPQIISINLAKNFGQAAAKMAALQYASGDVLVYMDDDGQHDPAGIFSLVKEVENGADVAIAAFYGKKHTAFKRFASWLNSELLRVTIQKPKNLQTSSFMAYSRFIVDILKTYNSPYVATFAFILQHTRQIVNVPMEHQKRMEGESGYTLKKLFRLWGDGIFSFSTVPLKLIFCAAVASTAIGVLLLLMVLVFAAKGLSIQTALIVGIVFFLGGIILFSQALMGEYIGRMYMTQNQLPQYSVRCVVREESEKK